MLPIGDVAAPKNLFFLLLWKRFSAFLNTRYESNTFPDLSHLFYKIVINDMDEDISAVVKVVVYFWWTINPDTRLGV